MANQTSCLVSIGGNGIPVVREVDGSPTIINVQILEVSNGDLTNPAPGVARIDTSGGGGSVLRVREQDGNPNVYPVSDIIVPNATLVDVGGGTIQLSFREDVDYAGKFEGATIGTGDISDGKWGWFYRTTDGKMFLVRNRSGTLNCVELTDIAA